MCAIRSLVSIGFIGHRASKKLDAYKSDGGAVEPGCRYDAAPICSLT